jgi:hypothetical protein
MVCSPKGLCAGNLVPNEVVLKGGVAPKKQNLVGGGCMSAMLRNSPWSPRMS